ncbi:MAG TPA: hypothetical protein VLA90_05890, partial [Actinomycetota bacterium]|nr:hypothetical protein [Actinomycetota bacterium]
MKVRTRWWWLLVVLVLTATSCGGDDGDGGGDGQALALDECFARLFEPRVEAARAIAGYSATLTEIFAAGRAHDGAAMAGAASELLARLGMPALPAAIRGVAEAAVDIWTKRRAASTAAAVVTSADPHVQA